MKIENVSVTAQIPSGENSPASARAIELADYIEQSTPPTYMDDVMFDRPDREVLIAALRSFHHAQRTQQWMDIETAPKDGTEVLLYTAPHFGPHEIAYWNDRLECWVTPDETKEIGRLVPSAWMALTTPDTSTVLKSEDGK